MINSEDVSAWLDGDDIPIGCQVYFYRSYPHDFSLIDTRKFMLRDSHEPHPILD